MPGPIFVDETGRRRRWVRRSTLGITAAVALSAAAVATAFVPGVVPDIPVLEQLLPDGDPAETEVAATGDLDDATTPGADETGDPEDAGVADDVFETSDDAESPATSTPPGGAGGTEGPPPGAPAPSPIVSGPSPDEWDPGGWWPAPPHWGRPADRGDGGQPEPGDPSPTTSTTRPPAPSTTAPPATTTTTSTTTTTTAPPPPTTTTAAPPTTAAATTPTTAGSGGGESG